MPNEGPLQVDLRIDTDTFSRSLKKTVFGCVWFNIHFGRNDVTYFPGSCWSDLPAGFVGAWLEALVAIGSHRSLYEEVFFMDGPYMVGIQALASREVRINFCRNDLDAAVTVLSGVASFDALIDNAVGVADEILRVYEERNWSDNDEAAIQLTRKRARDCQAGTANTAV